MSKYKLPNLQLEYLNEDKKFMVLQEYVTPEVIVGKDFVTSGSSAPWFAKFIFPRYDKVLVASVVHDWSYGGYMSRLNADRLFKKNLRRSGFGPVRSFVLYLMVRIGGGAHYLKRQAEGPQPNSIENLFPDIHLKGFHLK